jgi:hypothetical protein
MGAACAMEQDDAFWLVYDAVGRACSCMLGSKLVLPIPKRASVTVTSLLGRLRANKGSGSGGKIRRRKTLSKNRIITITRNQSRTGWDMRDENFIITV